MGKLEAPDGSAGAGIHANDVSAAGSGVEDGLVAEFSEDGHAERAVNRTNAGAGIPDEFSRDFVEGIKAILGGAGASPVGGDAMEDDEFFEDGRRTGAAVREGEAGEGLNERDFPDGLAIGGKGDATAV